MTGRPVLLELTGLPCSVGDGRITIYLQQPSPDSASGTVARLVVDDVGAVDGGLLEVDLDEQAADLLGTALLRAIP